MGTTALSLVKNYDAPSSIPGRRLVAAGSADYDAVLAAGTAAYLLGATGQMGSSGGRVDVYRTGLVDVVYGGDVARGDPITSDAEGRAVKATVAGSRLAGYAEVAGAAGDLGLVYLQPGTL